MRRVTWFAAIALALMGMPLASGQHPDRRAREKEIAAEARSFGEYNEMVTIPELLAIRENQGKQSLVLRRSLPQEGLAGSMGPQTDDRGLDSLAVNAGAVVMGHLVGEESHLTVDGNFIFTRYRVRVDRVFRTRSDAVKVGAEIHVARAGGTVRVSGVDVTGVDPDEPPLLVGHPIVFFLFTLPGVGAYKVTSSFDVAGAKPVGGRNAWVQTNVASEIFLHRVEASCALAGGGK